MTPDDLLPPLQKIFGPANGTGLNLIACNGIFDQGTKNYDKRLVVYAELSSSGKAP